VTDVLTRGPGELDPPRVNGRPGTRGRRQSTLWRIGGEIGLGWKVGLSVLGLGLLVAGWSAAAASAGNPSLFPTPLATGRALGSLWSDGTLRSGLWASGRRIVIGYSISVVIGIVLGLLMGSFASARAFFEAQIGFLRYIPATALISVFLLWFGIGEAPKIWMIVVGTVFFNVLMMADVARSVPLELVHAAYTLGASRWTVVRRVITRWSLPGIIDAARVNLAAAWLMLVVAELLASEKGLAVTIVRAQRFRAVDKMFAVLFTFGVIGLLSDLLLQRLRSFVAPWVRS
jgi:NitT/TauT family transport system permease protein